MKGNRAGYRDRWIAAVLWTKELTPSCKLVCLDLAQHMDDRGRVRRRHVDIAKDLQISNPKRVGDRIKEARDKQFLSQVGGTGINARTTIYDAMIPAPERARAPRQVPANRGPENRGPDHACDEPSRSPEPGDQYARVTYRNRQQQPAPVGSRAEPGHQPNSKTGDYGSWQSTLLKRLSDDPRTNVA